MAARGFSLSELFERFPDDMAARHWFEHQRWQGEPHCPHCGSFKVGDCTHKTMPWRCREAGCRKRFSVRVGTFMEDSKLGYRTWALAFYLLATSPKGVSSVQLAKRLGVTQKTAWFLAHRIRRAFEEYHAQEKMAGAVEVDETFVGGLERNKHADRKLNLGRGTVGKTIVAGVLDRATNTVSAAVVPDTRRATLDPFVRDRIADGATVYTDENPAYDKLPNQQAVADGRGEYVRGDCHINGAESFWAVLKRGYKGIHHKMSPKHLQRYLHEFAGRHNLRHRGGTCERMGLLVRGMEGRRLTYADLVKPNGLPSGGAVMNQEPIAHMTLRNSAGTVMEWPKFKDGRTPFGIPGRSTQEPAQTSVPRSPSSGSPARNADADLPTVSEK